MPKVELMTAALIGATVGIMVLIAPFMMGVVAGLVEAWMEERKWMGEEMSEKVLTPMKAIRAKCLECCNQQFYEVRLCTVTRCSLYPYRMGHRPKKDTNPNETSGEDS